ncbi:MAG TPA: sensor histidine kinase [Anseongella sp.]|nr:sensor histidine kinase [Anseongella sp.]
MVDGQESRFLILFLAGTFAFFLIAAGFILFYFRSVRKVYQKQLMLEKAESRHQQELLKSSIQAEEMERRRFSRDLHDEAGALLAGIKLKLNLLEKEPGNPERIKQLSLEAREMVDNTIRSVRHISHNLLPPSLETFGLFACLENFFRDLNSDIEAAFSYEGGRARLPQDTEVAMYRIVSELCNNTIKHAQAGRIMLHIKVDAGLLEAVYRDNGRGFNEGQPRQGLGMKNIESRVSMLNGRLALSSGAGKGMQAEIQIPL